MPNHGSTFYALNRDKRSIAIDLKQPDGREVFAGLLKTADVVLDNYAPGVLDRLGIGYQWGSSINPRIIYCAIRDSCPAPTATARCSTSCPDDGQHGVHDRPARQPDASRPQRH